MQKIIVECHTDGEVEFSGYGIDTLTANPDTRHGKEGYRVSRYTIQDDDYWMWDEYYQFYPTLGAILEAYLRKDYTAGTAAF